MGLLTNILGINLLVLLAAAVVYVLSVAVYRLVFSPVAKFPGPKFAALTYGYEAYYDIVKHGQYWRVIKEMHEKYGPIVRINPHELHIDDPEFHPEIYSGKGRWDKWDYYCNQFGNPQVEVFSRDHDAHRMRRGAVNPYFSKSKVNSLEPTLRRYIEKLATLLEKARGSDEKIPIRLAYECLTTDIITEYVMATSYNCLDDPTLNAKYHDMITSVGLIAHTAKQVPFLQPILQSLPGWLLMKLDPGMGLFISFQEECERESNKIRDIENAKSDAEKKLSIWSSDSTATEAEISKDHATVFHEILFNSTLPEEEKTAWRMRMEGMQFVSAGTDTVSNTLHIMTWHLIHNPDILRKLRNELLTVQPNPYSPAPLKDLETLPYLTGVIYESLRLSIGVSNRSARVAPDRVIKYKDWAIPPGTPMTIDAATMHFAPSVWGPDPEKFDPERWTDTRERQRLDHYMVAFSKGTRICLGINLAWTELYMITSTIFSRFDLETVDTNFEDHVRYHADMFFPHPRRDAGEMRIMVKG